MELTVANDFFSHEKGKTKIDSILLIKEIKQPPFKGYIKKTNLNLKMHYNYVHI